MTGASIEATLELWASSLRDVKARMRPLFSQERVAASANSFLDGLLGDERRKTGWMRAEAARDAGPWRQQAILGRGLAKAIGITESNLSLLKSGKVKGVRFSTIAAICRYLNCTPGDVLGYLPSDDDLKADE